MSTIVSDFSTTRHYSPTEDTLLGHALAYAARGWAIFPLKPGDKTPITKNGCNDATTNPDTIRHWWAKWSDANIGFACGRTAGVSVVDVDVDEAKGEDGHATLRELEEVNGAMPRTLKTVTPGGGAHYFLHADPPPANKNDFLPGIDIRGKGYYVVLPPSVHPNGGLYYFEDDDAPIAELPDWLRPENYKKAPPAAPAEPRPPRIHHADDDRKTRARAYLAATPPAYQGNGGHNALFSAATAMVHGFELSPADALDLLWNEYNPRCQPPWDAGNPKERKDFERKVDQAQRQNHDKPYGWLLDAREQADHRAAEEHGGEVIAAILAAKGMPVKPTKGSAAPVLKLVPVPAGELCGSFPELKPFVIDGLLRETETANVIAASKFGKTFLAISLALAVATDRDWLNQFAVNPGPVLYIDCELHHQTFAKRIRDVAHAMGIKPQEWSTALEVLSMRGQLLDIFTLAPFFHAIPRGKYRVIILDALYRLIPEGIDENSNADMTRIYNAVDAYGEATGAAFVIIHHSSKGGQGEKSTTDVGAGAGAIARAADTHFILRPHESEDDAAVMDAKARSFAPMAPMSIRWTYPTWAIAPDLEPVTRGSRGKKAAEKRITLEDFVDQFIGTEPRTQTRIISDARAAGIPEKRSRRIIQDADAAGKIFKHGGGGNRSFMYAIEPPADMKEAA